MERAAWFSAEDERRYRTIYDNLQEHLDEKGRRLLGAALVLSLPHGGQAVVAAVTGLAPDTLRIGAQQLRGERPLDDERVRNLGGGRKPIAEVHPEMEQALLALVAEETRGDPESPLLWTTKSLRHLAQALTDKGMPMSAPTVGGVLRRNGYSMQAPRKRFERGEDHPDRNAQFEYMAAQSKAFMEEGQPVVSVDTKTKELIGNYKNGGREYRRSKNPLEVNAHDFIDPEQGKAIPYGVYDPQRNEGWVSVGTTHDTAEFAVQGIRRWWQDVGAAAYPDATKLLITADGGGSNGSRLRLWKTELQRLSDETGLAVTVCHFPPGTSKWNKVEHRLWSAVSLNWRARPLTSLEVIVNLISATTTSAGLHVRCELDRHPYATGRRVDDAEMAALNMERPADVSPTWNYTIRPRVTGGS